MTRFIGLVLTTILFPGCSGKESASQALELGTQTQLLVDDFVIEEMKGVKRKLNPLTKHPANPVLRPEHPWEGQYTFPGTVLYDESEGLFEMWYACLEYEWDPRLTRSRSAYAVSRDGLVWERPELGLLDFKGSKKNNLIPPPRGNVFLDAAETDPSRRFKALGYCRRPHPQGPAGICISFSEGGLRWTPYAKNPVLTGVGDTHTLFGWDDSVNRYVAFMRPGFEAFADLPPELRIGEGLRAIGRSESEDFIHWPSPTPVLMPDDEDPPGTQFYGMSVFSDRSVYFGLIWVYHPNSLMVDVQLAFSRDGVDWQRAGGRHPILTYGLPDAFDSHALYARRPLVLRDQIWVYYVAEDEAHALTSSDISLQAHRPTDVALTSSGRTDFNAQSWLRRRRGYGGLATCRRDRFVSLDAGSNPGEVLTRAFVCQGNRLLVNADAGDGEIRVEVADEDGGPLAGFGLSVADPLKQDSLNHVVTWEGQADLRSLQGHSVRLRFLIKNSKLFSFRLEE